MEAVLQAPYRSQDRANEKTSFSVERRWVFRLPTADGVSVGRNADGNGQTSLCPPLSAATFLMMMGST